MVEKDAGTFERRCGSWFAKGETAVCTFSDFTADMRSVLGQLENEETSGPVELNLKSTLEKQLQDAKRDVQILLSLTFQQRKDIMEEERNRKSFTIKNILTVANSGKKKKRPSMRTSIVKVQRRSHVGKLCLSPVSALPHVPFPQVRKFFWVVYVLKKICHPKLFRRLLFG